jgi:MscS family membrane protein
VIELLILFAGLLVVFHHFGVSPTAALAGLGVGGIAIALAAQKVLENVIGGASLIFDQAVRVGEMLNAGNTLGVVEYIGLRSTRIRTLDRTVVSVPNGQIANVSVENLSSRDKFWFHPTLRLSYGTTSRQLEDLLIGTRGLLTECRQVETASVRVRFLSFGSSSLEVEVFAYVFARDWNEFLEIQEDLLLRIMRHVESVGIRIALPSQAIFLPAGSISDQAGGRLLPRTWAPKQTDTASARK